MGKDTVLVPLLPGFEEIEAVTIIDVLRRAEVPVIVASDRAGPVEGSHGLAVVVSQSFGEVRPGELAMIALPGGMPGAKNLAEHPDVQTIIRRLADDGGYVAAICAAPIALAAAGVHRGHEVTSYPGFEGRLEGATYVSRRVVVDRGVVTSRGPGTALEFALTLVELLRGPGTAANIENDMLVNRSS